MAMTEKSCRLQGQEHKEMRAKSGNETIQSSSSPEFYLFKKITPCFIGLISVYGETTSYAVDIYLGRVGCIYSNVHAVDTSGYKLGWVKNNKSKSLRCDTMLPHSAVYKKKLGKISYISTKYFLHFTERF